MPNDYPQNNNGKEYLKISRNRFLIKSEVGSGENGKPHSLLALGRYIWLAAHSIANVITSKSILRFLPRFVLHFQKLFLSSFCITFIPIYSCFKSMMMGIIKRIPQHLISFGCWLTEGSGRYYYGQKFVLILPVFFWLCSILKPFSQFQISVGDQNIRSFLTRTH